MNYDIADLRRDYAGETLSVESAPASPLDLFQTWFAAAREHETQDANAMTLATVDSQGLPHARVVLLKQLDDKGLVFFTNYQSHKGSELTNVPYAALVFWWPTLQRQVRIEGRVEKASAEVSDAYFANRPRDSQLGAWISQQSVEIPDRDWLEERKQRFEQVYGEQTVERPPHWGGYRVLPFLLEFWQGQPNRLHDRIRYRYHEQDAAWSKTRLAP
ncbi:MULTISPECIES: pyridoxamine 5'-phosphate oxidase [Chromohalobacter]|jgi:pyridoxamine 5'-phosphate oxidase|uniref:pyridoxamine 5'-phosphate oxidase n=1 Tax=Chromohalobacter TaxID=42054 RepID=UPI00054DE6FA|nr:MULTISPECIES: pyridoxamine 5'-phosphate oxidase [Chromohalobacter]MDF9434401.1 pyridoxamine 5'-phosphate oxidase [Chromohalobacter israelensis]MDO0946604.1 pyridoxamine 5'-phosphate oxidase [Chromohalobacter salexigens]NQY46779.1 pyridoxamine 5'-phosphate oxidase [Chromohalobacter sp.]NWO56654.1 pyridoxine/pyridoxamine 5'-phosphate oxidase [Chromohalobacter salexigens]PWW40654.1 pyridoxamine 5'-phosphate oxidase [Chromohalobacter salexigens]